MPEINIDIAQIPYLKSFGLAKCSPTVTNIGKAEKLEYLGLDGYQCMDLSEFSHLTGLKDFRLYYSQIRSLDGIESLTNLEYLDIAYAKNLQDVSALGRLEQKHKI